MARIAIITGSSRGIGRAIALKLGQQGFSIVVNYVGNEVAGSRVVQELRAIGANAIAVQADVSKRADVLRLFDEVEHTFGGVDLLINNASIMVPKAIAETEDEVFDRTFAINVRGTFNTLKLAAKRLRNGGRIINLSSTTIALALPRYAIYNATKAAVEALTKVLSRELRGRNITVNAVAPGPTETDIFFHGRTEESVLQFANMSPLERLGTAEDIANTVAFLVGPDGGWINGQTLRVNGGIA